MAWGYLVCAGLLEIGWPVCLKMAQAGSQRVWGVYAVWTGIGAAGTFAVGIALYGDPSSMGRLLGVSLIVVGVATLKLAH